MKRPSLEDLRKQATARRREHGITLSQAQHDLAREYGLGSWPKLVHAMQASQLQGIERALVLADSPALSAVLEADPANATAEITGLPGPGFDTPRARGMAVGCVLEAKARLDRLSQITNGTVPDAAVADVLRNAVITNLRQKYLDSAQREGEIAGR